MILSYFHAKFRTISSKIGPVAEKNGESNQNILEYQKREKRPEIEREERPAHSGPARGVRIHMLNLLCQFICTSVNH